MNPKYLALGMAAFGLFSAAKEARAACGSGLSCEMCNVSGFTPSTMAAPIGPTSTDCTDQDIADFDTACLATSATQQTCSTWESSASKSCLGCLVTQDTASSWGFLHCSSTGCQLNVQGCVDEALGQVSQEKQAGGSGSCGDLINASYGCQEYACSTCSTTDFANCANSAVANECASYVAPVESTTGACSTLNNNTQAQTCFAQDEQTEIAMATYMCGGGVAPPPDAGPPVDGGTSDGGTKSDAGSKTDAGKSGDAGGDAGSGTFGKGGCHCDVAGGGGDSLAFFGVIAAFAATLVRRKKR